MFFSASDFQIHKYGQKYCLNDVVSQCKLSTNPKSYYKDVKDKTLYKGNYYINKKSLIDILTKAKAPKSKELLELLTQEKVENTVSKPIVNFVDNGNNTIHFDNKTIKYFNYNDKVYFKAKEVAKILNYVDKDQSIRLNVDESDKIIKDNVFKGPLYGTGPYKTNELLKIESILADEDAKTIFINESGLYSLIFNSGKPEAKKFKHWVTSEVLPSIRKYGTYSIVNKMDYSVDKLDYYKDKDIIYVIYVKDNIYKFGTSYEITDRLNQHANNLKFNYIVKLYEVSNRTIALNCETKIKEMVKKLKIKSDFNNGLEFFETNLNYNINYVLELIDHIIAQTNLEHKYKACEIVSLNDINNLSELFKQMKQYVDTSLVNYQIVNKAQQLALIEEKLEINKEKELFYQVKIKELELEIKKMELQIEKIKKPSLIQQLINAKIIGNGKENTDSIDLDVTEELEEETSSGKKKTTTVAKIQNHPNKQCADCGCDIGFRSSRCGPCENKKRLKQSIETNKTRPTLSQLKSDLKTMSYVQVGKKYNVSDNCIRKWIRKYKSYNKLAN